jgi:hypothetical protein
MESESKTYPKIERSKREKMIFFPDNIRQVKREMEEGKLEDFYVYDCIKIPDRKQQIEDYELFRKENYAALRRQRYGSWEEQLEMMQEKGFDTWINYCESVKVKYPKLVKLEK